MKYKTGPALAAAILTVSVVVSGCLSGPAPTPKVSITLLTDAEVSAEPNWTVGWVVEVFESIGDSQTAVLTADPPTGWQARFLNTTLAFAKANARRTTFLLLDVPETQANGTYAFTVRATVGADHADAKATVKVARPTSNVITNGTVVQIDYVGFLEDNRVFDSSMWAVANSSGLDKWPDFVNSSAVRTQVDYKPLQLTEGSHQVIQGWELGLMGMSLGQGRALIIPPDLAYGRFTNQTVNRSLEVSIYNTTTVASFTPQFGTAPVRDAQYIDPTFGWTVQVVSVDSTSGSCVLKNLPMEGGNYTPYGINATVVNVSSAKGTFELNYAPVLDEDAANVAHDTGKVIALNDTAFTIRWQTEHRQTLAPYSLYFLMYVRTAKG